MINFENHKFHIIKEGILFWLEKEIAIVSDLHLEKGSSFISTGQFIPPYDSEETLKKLLNVIDNYKVKKVILLGDTFHDKDAFHRMSLKAKSLFYSLIKNYEVIFILGNHEEKMKIEKIQFHKKYVINGLNFLHKSQKKNMPEIFGHFHPVATIRVGSRKITAKCLVQTNLSLIMPSFGEYTGGLNIKDKIYKSLIKKKYKVYILGKKSIYEFPQTMLE